MNVSRLVYLVTTTAVLIATLAGCTARPLKSSKVDLALVAQGVPLPAAQALDKPRRAIVYSMPDPLGWGPYDANLPKRDGAMILGKTPLDARQTRKVAALFRSAILKYHPLSVSDGGSSPHFILSLGFDHHRFDFMGYLNGMQIFEDDKQIGPFELGMFGTRRGQAKLIEMMRQHNVPLAYRFGKEFREEQKKEIDQIAAGRTRFDAAMPTAIVPFWDQIEDAAGLQSYYAPLPMWRWTTQYRPVELKLFTPVLAALKQEFPMRRERVLALLAWYGSGDGPWSGYEVTEDIPPVLLSDFGTRTIIHVLSESRLTQPEKIGAGRYFTMNVERFDPYDAGLLPPRVKAELVAAVARTHDKMNMEFLTAPFLR